MRKDKLSSYQAKKQKLQKIKKLMKNQMNEWLEQKVETANGLPLFYAIWRIVEDE